MKNLKIFSLLLLTILGISCSDDNTKGKVAYDGASQLNFDKETSKQVYVFSGTGFTETEISFGTLKPTSGSNTVTLVPDVANSTAVEGVDYEIINETVVLNEGEVTGVFTVKFLEGPATQAGKKVVFNLSSSTLDNAVFHDTFTVNVNLTCEISSFLGVFSGATWWLGASSHDVTLGTAENTLDIVDFWEDNGASPNFVVSYNADFIVTFADQDTGYYHPTYGANVRAKMSTDASKVSSLNPCTRTMSVWVNYYIPGVGSFGDKQEVFTGM